MVQRIFHLQALSALHVGTGQGVGVVDLPIARAKATNLPIVPGSAIKGILRDEVGLSKEDTRTLFGPESSDNENAHAGAVAFGDAHLLILPIRSFAGTVAYATSPFILRQYKRDLNLPFTIPSYDGNALLTETTVLKVTADQIALEDLDLNSTTNEEVQQWAETIASQLYPESVADYQIWREEFIKRFVILPDDHFSFLADTATEVRIRIKIERETRIVKDGALWSEENLPAESVLWGVVGVNKARDKSGRSAEDLSKLLPAGESHLQIGGKHTVGRGLTRFILNQA